MTAWLTATIHGAEATANQGKQHSPSAEERLCEAHIQTFVRASQKRPRPLFAPVCDGVRYLVLTHRVTPHTAMMALAKEKDQYWASDLLHRAMHAVQYTRHLPSHLSPLEN